MVTESIPAGSRDIHWRTNPKTSVFLCLAIFLPFEQPCLHISEIIRLQFLTLFGVIPGSGFVVLDKPGISTVPNVFVSA
jgi:hypothetical protein